MTENLSVSVGQTFATVPMRKIRLTMVIGWGWVGRVGVREVEVGGGGWGVEVGGWENWEPPDPKPPTPTPSTPTPPPDFNPPNPNPQLSRPNPHPNLSPLCGKFSTSALLQTFVRRLRSNSRSHIRYVANLLCGESSVANLPCGESSGNHKINR